MYLWLLPTNTPNSLHIDALYLDHKNGGGMVWVDSSLHRLKDTMDNILLLGLDKCAGCTQAHEKCRYLEDISKEVKNTCTQGIL